MFSLISNLRSAPSSKLLFQFFTVLFLWSFVEGMVTFYFPLHIESQLKSVVVTGVLLGVSSLASVVTDLVFGFVSEISDHRKFLYLGLGSYLLVIPLLAYGQGIIPLLIAVLIWGVQFELIVNFGAPIFLAKNSPHGDFPRASSLSFLIRNVGFFVGPIMADYLRLNRPSILYLLAGSLLMGALIMLYMSTTSHAGHHHAKKVRHLNLLSEMRILRKFLPQVFPFLVLGFGIGVYESVFVIFGPIEFARISNIAGFLSAMTVLSNIIIPIFAVWILSEYREQVVMTLSGVFLLLASLGYAVSEAPWLLALTLFWAFSLLALIFLSKDSAFLHILSRTKVSEEDEAVGITSMGPNIAYVIVGLLGGIVMQELGFNAVVLTAAVILVVCVFVFVISRPNGASGTSSKVHK